MKKEHDYIPLSIPTPVTEQVWPEGTLPIVAVNVNTYNHCQFIRDCIEGIIMQKTTFPVRVLIFDDCSTDGTREIVQEYEAKYPHLITGFYPKENTFRKPNRSEALKPRKIIRDTALYIAVCEGDDYWVDPLKLQKQVDFLDKNSDYNFSVGRVKTIDEEGQIRDIHEFANPNIRSTYTLSDYITYRFSQTSTFLYRNNFRKPSFFTNAFSGDQAIVIAGSKDKKIYYHKDVFSHYRINKNSVSFTVDPAKKYMKMVEFWHNVNTYTNKKHSFSVYMNIFYIKCEKRFLKKGIIFRLVKAIHILRIIFLYKYRDIVNGR